MSTFVISGLAAFAAVANARDFVSDMELEHFDLVNELRAEGWTCPNGEVFAPNPVPLVFDCRLWRAAMLHSEDMARNNYFSHNSQNGDSFLDRAEAQGVKASGENIHWGKSGAFQAWRAFRGSKKGHCNAMMHPNKRIFGVGAAEIWAGYRDWTQMYGPASELATLDQSCIPAPGQTPVPTPEPTWWPTAAPRPTPQPSPAPTDTEYPTFSPTYLCRPKPGCNADNACWEKYLPLCSTYGSDICGLPFTAVNDPEAWDPETLNCVLELAEGDDVHQECVPHPGDGAATFGNCSRTFYMTEAQCVDGGVSRGVSCMWIDATQRFP